MKGSTDVSIAPQLRGFSVVSVVLEYHDPLQITATASKSVFTALFFNIKDVGITLLMTVTGKRL